jgi:hypothetical protein
VKKQTEIAQPAVADIAAEVRPALDILLRAAGRNQHREHCADLKEMGVPEQHWPALDPRFAHLED